MRPEQPLVVSWLFWCLLWLVVTAIVPEVSEIATLGRPELAYRSHNFELSWGLQHIPAGVVGIIVALFLMRRAPILSAIGVVVLTLEIAFAVLDYRRNGFLGDGQGRIGAGAFVLTMAAASVLFAAGCLFFRRREALLRRNRGWET